MTGPGPGGEPADVLSRALAAAEEERWDDAAHLLRDAVAAEPENADYQCWLGVVERELGWLTRAAQAYEEARALVPGDTEVLHHLDRLYRELGRDRARAEILEDMAEGARGPDRVALQRDAAALHAGPLGTPQAAVRLLLRATGETPRKSALHAELLRSLGDALRVTGPLDAWARCAEAGASSRRCRSAQASSSPGTFSRSSSRRPSSRHTCSIFRRDSGAPRAISSRSSGGMPP